MYMKQNSWGRLAAAYLQQPIFSPHKPIFWNPFTFIRNERMQLLERCYQLDYEAEIFRARLELYWQECILAIP
ncbi:MAG: hypothetical protein F6K00_32735 [Leptolyngbya sp. SIOISBB]|nr:hypothetical protein [Leptolyngbya sp. SIOISBB]